MAKVKVLVKGYAKEVNEEEFASSTVTLIQENNINIIVDPGMDKKALLDGLNKEGLSPKDIDFIILTHTHLDHCLLTAIFEEAEVLDNSDIFSYNGQIGEHGGKVPGTGVEIINTPGHDPFHCSILIETEDLGKVIIAGDLFWWSEDEKQGTTKEELLNHKDPYMKNEKRLRESREKVLNLADYIIPGHGDMFKVNK